MSRPFSSSHISDVPFTISLQDSLPNGVQNEFVYHGFLKKLFSFPRQQFHLFSVLPLCVLLIVRDLFNMKREGQMYSMLISLVHAQSKSSLHCDGLKSSPHTDWSHCPLQPLLLMRDSCKCDNVPCSEIRAISVHLAPNVSKMPVSFSGWMGVMAESGLLQEWTLVKGAQ